MSDFASGWFLSFGSSGGCIDEIVEDFCWCLVSEGFAGSLVEFVGDEVEVVLAER
jgi:hypothetical protein